MKIKIIVPHPHVKPVHVKHTAAILTIGAGASEIVGFIPHLGALLFVVAGCLAIYENSIVHTFHADIDNEETNHVD